MKPGRVVSSVEAYSRLLGIPSSASEEIKPWRALPPAPSSLKIIPP